jgi:predicted peroxiredoxin
MADSNTVFGVIVALGPALAIAIGAVVVWLKAEAKNIESTKAAQTAVTKLTQSNSQGDSLASMGAKLGGAIIKDAMTIPTLKPFVDEATMIYDEGVKIWNDENGSDAEMADTEKALDTVLGLIQKALPAAPVPSPAPVATPAAVPAK